MRLLLTSLFFTLSLYAEFINVDVRDANRSASWIVLPYAFSSESMGFTGGLAGIFNGFGQKQMTIIATAFAGESLPVEKMGSTTQEHANSQGGALVIYGYQPSFPNRMFISLYGSYAYYPNQKLYLNASNESTKVDYEDPTSSTSTSPLYTQGYNNWAYATFRYMLPWGELKDHAITTYKLNRGIPVNRDAYGGGEPFVTGRSILELRPFYTKWTADKLAPEPQWKSSGLKMMFQHDNTDYINNPSRGYGFKVQYAQDFGGAASTQSWNNIEASYSQYVPLPDMRYTRGQSLAFNVWSAYSPSWEHDLYKLVDPHQPPPWEGAHLGGWNRLRAYDSNRFHDKAAIYYGAEYRVIPQFNPLRDEKWLPFPIDWFQTVLFAELGRVAPKYDLSTLHTQMKGDVGFSLRALAAKVPVRFDMAWGSEGSNMWVFIGQPF
jgi:outer membrane protein assembly factor BamA